MARINNNMRVLKVFLIPPGKF